MKLDECDKRVLALLGTQSRSVSTLAADLDVPPEKVSTRLADLADNGLVYDLDDDRYTRTESGRRVLVASAAGTADERIDTSPEVERTIDEFDLRADEADAVRHAFAFLRYWGQVTEEEIIDAIYDEAPAGRETPAEWWDDLVEEPLAALPGVEEPGGDDDPWRYQGTPEASALFTDGRRVFSRTHPVYGDVKHALESLDLTEAEREAARAAFVCLYRRGEVTDRDVRETVYPEHPAGYDSSEAWWDEMVTKTFDALPGVERTGENGWRYRHRDGQQRRSVNGNGT